MFSPTPEFSLRQATDADKEECYHIHCAAMHDVVDQVYGWDEDFQVAYFARNWDPQEIQVVTVEDRTVGSITLVVKPDLLHLTGFELDPAFQGRGIGTGILKRLQAEAAGRGVPLFVGVLVVNRRAKALYDRMGFEEVGRSEVKIEMRWEMRKDDGAPSRVDEPGSV